MGPDTTVSIEGTQIRFMVNAQGGCESQIVFLANK